MSIVVELTDQELLQELRNDSQASFTEIFNRYSKNVFLTAKRLLPDDDVCDDIVQDIFEWLWNNRQCIEVRCLKSYLMSAARFKVLNVLKRGRFTEQLIIDLPESDPFDSAEFQYEVKELLEVIKQFTAELPPQAGRIFHMSRSKHLSNKEIAQELGLSEKTVKKQINIALKRLKVKLGRRAFFLNLFL